ncbi:MAG TPA: endo-1,4-beta-xylanase [Caulobacteraceae bacterium]|jgi:endo-1,4-beta-xylanase|nr:endo-1,4-beta-xylanase [Caulobacteraceae bacterium]
MGLFPPSRRDAIALTAGLALSACGRAQSAPAAGPTPPLKQTAPFPVGASIVFDQLADPSAMALLTREFGQITPGLEMKMETVLRGDGGFDFARADAMAAFARTHGLRLHAHTLVWYIYRPEAFVRIAADRGAFANAYRNYILAVAGRYRGQATGWDVVNEPTAEDGDGYRACLWREAFGMDYVAMAFHHAREADPDAVLFLNEYNLESLPKKRASFLRLVEDLLKRGVPLGGIGTQMHMGFDQDPKAIAPMMRELAGFGLPIHVSELDVSTRARRIDLGGVEARLQAQARLVEALAEAYLALPARQRYAFTAWGLRDKDSWLRSPLQKGDPDDRPLLFDDQGRPKAAARAFVQAMGRA